MRDVIYYQDDAGTWHICFLDYYTNRGLEGYVFAPFNIDVESLMVRNNVFLAKIDSPNLWYIPDIGSNRQKLAELVELQKQVFEASVKAQ